MRYELMLHTIYVCNLAYMHIHRTLQLYLHTHIHNIHLRVHSYIHTYIHIYLIEKLNLGQYGTGTRRARSSLFPTFKI